MSHGRLKTTQDPIKTLENIPCHDYKLTYSDFYMQITDLAARTRKNQQLYYFAYIIYQYGKRLSMDSPDCAVVKDISLNPEAIWLGESLYRNRPQCYDVNIQSSESNESATRENTVTQGTCNARKICS